jgi:hypothetical protein
MTSQKSYLNRSYMDGILIQRLHGNLHQLSEESLSILVSYYVTGILSLKDQNLLLNEEIGDDLGRHERMAEAMYEC